MLKLGTAKITNSNGLWVVNYMNHGSFLVGQQMFGNRNAAIEFCRERDLRVLA